MPKSISFLPNGSSETFSPQDQKPDTTSETTPIKLSTSSVVLRSPAFFDAYSPRQEVGEPTYRATESSFSFKRTNNPYFWLEKDERRTKSSTFPIRTTFTSSSVSPRPKQLLPNDDLSPNSGKVKNFNTKPEEASPSPLLAWTACLGVGAIIIVVLIVLAVRSLRRSASKRRKMRSDFLSETTASSVNSSSATTCSQISRSPQQEGIKEDEEDLRWNYEASYGVSRHMPTTTGLPQRPPLPTHVLPCPPEPPHCPLKQSRSPSFLVAHGHPSCLMGPTLPPLRVGNTSFIENCVVTHDPSPLDQRTNY